METKKKILQSLKGEQEIVINKCFGGFGLSMKAIKRYCELKGFKIYPYMRTRFSFKGKEKYKRIDDEKEIDRNGLKHFHYSKKDLGKTTNKLNDKDYFGDYDIKRDDGVLVKVVKELKSEANGEHSELNIVKIPSDVEWEIDDYDGIETIHEKHRSW